MKHERCILALDQGTTSSRAVLINSKGQIHAWAQMEFPQHYHQPGWVEHDPHDLWKSQFDVIAQAMRQGGLKAESIAAIGITNQRETTLVWDRATGEPLGNAIVWQDRRTAEFCEQIKQQGLCECIQKKTGLVLDAYFSAGKLKWILDAIPGARQKAHAGQLAFGTVDTWLLWKLTGGKVHATDATNAARTMLYNIHDLTWDNELLEIFDIPPAILPEVKNSSGLFGETASAIFDRHVPITGIAGDQQAALFGQQCLTPGMVKNTYGTGCFLVMNTGNKPVASQNRLLTTLAWVLDGKPTYALEGSVFIAGAAVQWLRDGLGLINHSRDIEALAQTVTDNGGIYFVPALTGLGAPHWDPHARGLIVGLNRSTTAGHFARAALEAIAYQTCDVLHAMTADAGIKANELRVDGGASENSLLMQFQADLSGLKVVRPRIRETTALGAAFLAGLAVGFWNNFDELGCLWQKDIEFTPQPNPAILEQYRNNWAKAIQRAKDLT